MSLNSTEVTGAIGPGAPVTIVKLKPDGTEAIRYPGEIISAPSGWVAARCPWKQRRVDLGYLVFEPDDVFLEYFSLTSFFNAFAVYTGAGELKGWYCNVTLPSWVEEDTVFWHDLYIDVIAYPDGRILVVDEDELAESNLETRDPDLHQQILEARDRLVTMAAVREYPFDQQLSFETFSDHP